MPSGPNAKFLPADRALAAAVRKSKAQHRGVSVLCAYDREVTYLLATGSVVLLVAPPQLLASALQFAPR